MREGVPDDDAEPRARPPRRRKKKRAPVAVALEAVVAPTWLPRRAGVAVGVVAATFLALVFLDNAAKGTHGPDAVKRFAAWATSKVPRPLRYFTQIAGLFPRANRSVIEYHAEGWICRDKAWREIDLRPWFPIDADDKENRFARVMGFYSRDRKVMEALEAFVVGHQDQDAAHPIGGARFSVLHVPLPALGAHVERYAWHPLAGAPDAWKHDLYWTRLSRRRERCVAQVPGYDDRDVDDAKAAHEKRPEPPGDARDAEGEAEP
jgi:hypothetical protein